MLINCLTIKQPYIDLILNGIKTLEVRTWKTNYRGKLFLTSSKQPCIDNKLCGYILGFVEIVDVRKMTLFDSKESCVDFKRNHMIWVLNNPTKIEPIQVKGKQGIFGINLKEAINLL